jgi:tetratricopeptide (TPR) repeat protein
MQITNIKTLDFYVRANRIMEARQFINNTPKENKTVTFLLSHAKMYFENNPDKTITLLKKALKMKKETTWIYFLMYQSYRKQKQTVFMDIYLNLVLKELPKTSLDLCGKAYIKIYFDKDLKSSEELFEKAQKLDQNNVEAKFGLFKIYNKLKKNIKALKILKSILKIQENNFKAYKHLLYYYKGENNPEKGLKIIKKIKKHCTIDWEITKLEGDFNLEMNNNGDALRLYHSLLSIENLKEKIILWEGKIYEKMGLYKKVS